MLIDPVQVEKAVQLLEQGELIGLPTETVYGLAADACHDLAVARIFELKGRPTTHPLIVHIASIDQLAFFVDPEQVPAFARHLIAAFWPGPITLVLPRRKGIASKAAGDHPTIALRCPAHPLAQAVLQAATTRGIPGLAAPSANRFGGVSPTCAAHVHDEFGQTVWVLDGGSCEIGIESSIVDATTEIPRLLRPGILSIQDLSQAGGIQIQVPTGDAQNNQSVSFPASPGRFPRHYAPRARVRWMDESSLLDASEKMPTASSQIGGIGVYGRLWAHVQANQGFISGLGNMPSHWIYRAMPKTASALAHELFAVLREFDAQGVAEIWVQCLPQGQQWAGIQDRLDRAKQ
jgi:L-threonylcarbamoyladenylate synthase